MSAQTLHPLTLPLRGSQLIEASAGTGKTWTIAALYLRLVLGHGDANTRAPRAVLPPDILVMTFTRAATRELSERIRSRLAEAVLVFRGQQIAQDAFLQALLDDHASGPEREQAAHRLALAAQCMDEAAIYTLDAWCQRVLREHALGLGQWGQEELVSDEAALRLQAVQDYWRQQLYPLDVECVARVLGVWPSVQALDADMRELLSKPISTAAGDRHAETVDQLLREQQARLQALKQGWGDKAVALLDWVREELAPKGHAWNGKRLPLGRCTDWLQALQRWAQGDGGLRELQGAMGAGWDRFTPEGLLSSRKAGAAVPLLPDIIHAYAALLQGLEGITDLRTALRQHASASVRARVQALKRQQAQFGFADLQERLAQALAQPEVGERLAQRLRDRYPVALIDEFQDTSPLQVRILDVIYRMAGNVQDSAVLLIGDPKQSIYAFRGADIHSYLQVRRATAGRHHVLGTNHRSSAEVVDAVNRFFQLGQALPTGAFDYGDAQSDDPLPFVPVQAQGRPEVFHTRNGPAPALTWIHDALLRTPREALRQGAALCAEQIVTWLNDPQARFVQASQADRPLRARDIAVLVRTAQEASAVRAALRQRGVPSVYLSDRDSVFASDEATDLCLWLQGVAQAQDVRAVRAALGTRTVGLTLDELVHLADDDAALDARLLQMRQLRQVWQTRGILAMLRQSLHRLNLAQRWRTEPDGERRLTNVLHLAELLQQASQTLDGEQALVRWLAQAVADAGSGQDEGEQVLRLESDEALVQVITIHKSKGLEFPLVCLPFAHSQRSLNRQKTLALPHEDEGGERAWTLNYDEADWALAERDHQREDLRLWYVALTRAQHALWVSWSPIRRHSACINHLSAAGRLLGAGQAHSAEQWFERVQTTLSSWGPSVQALTAPVAVPRTPWVGVQTQAVLQTASRFDGDLDRSWRIASFSRLTRELSPDGSQTALTSELPLALQTPRPADDEPLALATWPAPLGLSFGLGPPTQLAADADDGVSAPWHLFPRGPAAGNFLHDQLEWLAVEGFALAQDVGLQRRLQRACERAGFAEQAAQVQAWLLRVLAQPLSGPGVGLSALTRVLPEMEFWLPAERLDTVEIDRLCRTHWLPGVPRPALASTQLHGMLMGFADLVFEHAGRYWVLDYKSNHLGPSNAHYSASELAQAMAEHRYDVQAALYLLALHRLLRARLGLRYQAARDLGGAVYLFLRGIDGPAGGCCTLPVAWPLLQGLEAMLDASPAGGQA